MERWSRSCLLCSFTCCVAASVIPPPTRACPGLAFGCSARRDLETDWENGRDVDDANGIQLFLRINQHQPFTTTTGGGDEQTMDDESSSAVKREEEGAAAAAAAAADSEYAGIPSKRPLPVGDDEQHHAPLPSGSGTKAYLAHAASHLSSANNSSRSPSPSSSSPRHTPSAAPGAAGGSTSKHKLPPHYRGPLPRDDDPEDVAPLPLLHVAPNAIASSSRLYQPTNTPLDRNSWRYTFAGPCTSHLPTSVYRSIPSQPDCIRWDWSDRSAFTKLSREADLVASEKGWRSIRSNVPVREGSWYVEMHVLPPNDGEDGQQHASASSGKDGPHVRLGWARREAPLNAPVGFDGYSYALRDTTGQCESNEPAPLVRH